MTNKHAIAHEFIFYEASVCRVCRIAVFTQFCSRLQALNFLEVMHAPDSLYTRKHKMYRTSSSPVCHSPLWCQPGRILAKEVLEGQLRAGWVTNHKSNTKTPRVHMISIAPLGPKHWYIRTLTMNVPLTGTTLLTTHTIATQSMVDDVVEVQVAYS